MRDPASLVQSLGPVLRPEEVPLVPVRVLNQHILRETGWRHSDESIHVVTDAGGGDRGGAIYINIYIPFPLHAKGAFGRTLTNVWR